MYVHQHKMIISPQYICFFSLVTSSDIIFLFDDFFRDPHFFLVTGASPALALPRITQTYQSHV